MTQFIAGITTYCKHSVYDRTVCVCTDGDLGLFALRVFVLYEKALWVIVLLGGLILAHQAQVIVRELTYILSLADRSYTQWSIALSTLR